MFFHSKYWLLSLIIILSCEGPLFEIPAEPDTTPPIVVITNPADRAILSDSVLVTIFATDNDEVELVQLFINDSLVLDSAKAPYEYKWNTADYEEDEFHNLRARAVDFAQNDNQTSPVRVTVDNIDNIKPTGSLLYPFSGQILNGSVSIIAEANDNDSLKSVVYYINGDSVGVKNSPPFIYEWDTTLEYDDYYYGDEADTNKLAYIIANDTLSVGVSNYLCEDEDYFEYCMEFVSEDINGLDQLEDIQSLRLYQGIVFTHGTFTAIAPEDGILPDQFNLYANYPNPFNPVTTIRFDVGINPGDKTTIKIYDISGRNVAILINEKLQTGAYEVQWNAHGFSSGVYFAEFVSGLTRQTQKMILLK